MILTYINNTIISGVNVLGYFKYNFGIGELGRLILACLEHTRIPYVVNNLEISLHNLSTETIKNINDTNIYPINIIVANAKETNLVLHKKGTNYFKGKYNIGVWCWETEYFPEVPKNILKYFNEIWTISEFCRNTIAKIIRLPVSVIKLPVILPENIPYFPKIDRNKFVILFTFDFLSVPERKNPLGVISAFKIAFGHDQNVVLVIKSINQKYCHKNVQVIKRSVQDHNNIILFDESLPRSDMLALVNSCDVYLSLHRSEGLGLCMQEAMAMGKIVIATNYSGNLDFMSNGNSLLIKYNKVQISSTARLYYHKGAKWAEPNIFDAADKLKYIYENSDIRETIKTNAKKFIGENYNLDVCSSDMISKIINIQIDM